MKNQVIHEEWIERNPLRVWRRDQGLSVSQVASILGVTIMTLGMWEKGITTPNSDNMNNLNELFADDLTEAWDQWKSDRPSLS